MTKQTAMLAGETQKSQEPEKDPASDKPEYIGSHDNGLSGLKAISALEYAARKYNEKSGENFRAVVQDLPRYNSKFELGEEQPARLELSKYNQSNSETVLASKIAYPSDQGYNLEFEYQGNDIADEKRKLETWYTEYVSEI